MPWSAVRRFADPDAFFASIRNLQIEGFVERRGNAIIGRELVRLRCAEFLGMSPTQYVPLRRLEAVRRALRDIEVS
jgi:hypothetical protein